MATRYDRRYDYGLRGFDDLDLRRREVQRRALREGGPRYDTEWERRAAPRSNRVTARYNQDYVYGARGVENYPRNYNPYTGDRPQRIGDERYYRQPYTTIGGTRTFRGAPYPIGYDQGYVEEYADYDTDFRR